MQEREKEKIKGLKIVERVRLWLHWM